MSRRSVTSTSWAKRVRKREADRTLGRSLHLAARRLRRTGRLPVASLLDKLVRDETGILETLDALTAHPPDEIEWTGASTRYLESYPDHPVLLAVRALGEAWKRDGSRTEFRRLANEYAAALHTFSVTPDDATEVTSWTLEHLRAYFGGLRWDWSLDIWRAIEAADITSDVLGVAEDDVLDHAANREFHSGELFIVLNRRTSRAVAVGDGIVHHHEIFVGTQ